MYCGLDWSEWRKGGERVRVAALAGVNERQSVATLFRETRLGAGLPANFEFRAHDCGVENTIRILDGLDKSGVVLRVAISGGFESVSNVDSGGSQVAANWHFQSGIQVIRAFAERYQIARIACDHDIAGHRLQRLFTTEGKRAIRHTGAHMKPTITFEDSASDECVQIADLVAYGVGRMLRGDLDNVRLRRIIDKICDNQSNVIIL